MIGERNRSDCSYLQLPVYVERESKVYVSFSAAKRIFETEPWYDFRRYPQPFSGNEALGESSECETPAFAVMSRDNRAARQGLDDDRSIKSTRLPVKVDLDPIQLGPNLEPKGTSLRRWGEKKSWHEDCEPDSRPAGLAQKATLVEYLQLIAQGIRTNRCF